MADNATISTGVGDATIVIATKEVAAAHQQIVRQSFNGPVPTILSRFLDETGDGSGNKNAISDYSTGTTDFKIVPGAGVVMRLTRLLVTIGDGSMTAFYGGLGSALSNGIVVQKRNAAGVVIDLTDAVPVTTNADWGSHCYDVGLFQPGGAGDEFMHVRWTFTKADHPIRLDGDAGEFFTVRMADNLTGLSLHRFLVQGYIE